MRPVVLILSLVTFQPLNDGSKILESIGAPVRQESPALAVPLRDDSILLSRGGAGRTYEELQSKSVRERARALELLPASMRSAVWSHHLLTTLAQHPEFTGEQKAVIQFGLAIMTPQLFEVERSDTHWAELVDQPLRELARRAKAAFGPKVARELFVHLGPDAVPPGTVEEEAGGVNPAAGKTLSTLRIIIPRDIVIVPTCACSTEDDYCDTSGLGFYYCQQGSCWSSMSGCGTFLRYPCNGMCASVPG
jgi:hypothetical protein